MAKPRFIIESLPAELAGQAVTQDGALEWINRQLDEGLVFSGFVPGPRGMITGAVFLVGGPVKLSDER